MDLTQTLRYVVAVRSLVIISLVIDVSDTLNNGLARTPPMGWLAWERFRCNIDCKLDPQECISAQLYKDMADRLVSDGYAAAGYQYVNIDDCWMAPARDPHSNKLYADPERFPKGMRDLVEYVHSKGLKIGMYESFGERTCMGYPGSQYHLKIDAQTFAELKFDFLKFDGCFTQTDLLDDGYRNMGRYLNDTGRPMVYSCSWPYYKHVVGITPNFTEIGQYCNLWRVWHDIDDSWSSIQNIVDYYVKFEPLLQPAAGPGRWNDPDMLIIGNFGLSYEQSKAQMALWAIFAAPLLMSNDLRAIKSEYRDILLNEKVIAVNQDRLGIQGRRIAHRNGLEIWKRPISPLGSAAVVVFNRRIDGTPLRFKISLQDMGLVSAQGYLLEDVFTGAAPVRMYPQEVIKSKVNPSGVLMYVLKKWSRREESADRHLAAAAAVDSPAVLKHAAAAAVHIDTAVAGGAWQGERQAWTSHHALLYLVLISTALLSVMLFKQLWLRLGAKIYHMWAGGKPTP